MEPLRRCGLAGDVLVIAGEDTLSTNHHVVAALKGSFRHLLYEAERRRPDIETLLGTTTAWVPRAGPDVDAQLRAAQQQQQQQQQQLHRRPRMGQPRKQQPWVSSEYRAILRVLSKYYYPGVPELETVFLKTKLAAAMKGTGSASTPRSPHASPALSGEGLTWLQES